MVGMGKKRLISTGMIITTMLVLLLSTGGVTAGTSHPKPLSPKGEITDTTPTYKWTEHDLGTRYRFQVLKDGTPVFSETVTSVVCSPTKCVYTPTTALALGEHKWRVRAFAEGVWEPYSSKKTFTVVKQPAGFDSQFTSGTDGWKQQLGKWKAKNGKYTTQGITGKGASASHNGDYLNITFSARVKRLGCDFCANALYLRGTPKPIHSSGNWHEGYAFQFTNDSRFSVFKTVAGSITQVKGWTTTTTLNNFDWNKIKVVVDGSTMKFYINNTLVWKGKDTSLTKGVVGLRMYRDPSSTGNKMYVDWAKVEVPASSGITIEEVDTSDQVEQAGGDFNMAPSLD